jgi:hypothetical protein
MRRVYYLDWLARTGMVAGVGLMLQPWWAGGFGYGFFATAAFTLLHIFTSHLRLERP